MGEIAVKCYGGAELADGVLPKLFSIADASWKLACGVSVTSSEARKRFFEELSRSSETADRLRIWFLEVNEKPIASETQIVDGQTVYALRSDYDEKFADRSPGVYLQREILKRIFGGHYTVYNFGVGLNPYKARWAENSTEFFNFRLYRGTVYSRLLQWVDQRRLRAMQPGSKRSLSTEGSD